MTQLHGRHAERFRGFITPPRVSGEKGHLRTVRKTGFAWLSGAVISFVRLRVPLISHNKIRVHPGALRAASLAAEDPGEVTHQATFLFFSMMKVWLFLKSCNFVGLLFF